MSVRRTNGAREGPGAIVMPSDDVSLKKTIRREVLKKVSLHPMSVVPTALGVGTAAFTAIVGISPVGVGAAIGLVLLGAGSWATNYILFGSSHAVKIRNRLHQQITESRTVELSDLEAAFKAAKFKDGLKEVRELTQAYETLRANFGDVPESDVRARAFVANVDSAYIQAVEALEAALAIYKNMRKVDVEGHGDELRELVAKRADLGNTETNRTRALDLQIKTQRERIAAHRASEEHIANLLARSNQIEAIFEMAAQEPSNLVNSDTSAFYQEGGGATQLEQAMAAARELREATSEMRRGLDLTEIDRVLNAGHTQQERT